MDAAEEIQDTRDVTVTPFKTKDLDGSEQEHVRLNCSVTVDNKTGVLEETVLLPKKGSELDTIDKRNELVEEGKARLRARAVDIERAGREEAVNG